MNETIYSDSEGEKFSMFDLQRRLRGVEKQVKNAFTLIGFLTVLVLMLSFGGCARCVPESTVCHGNRLEICNASGFWDTIMDCYQFGPEWHCVTEEIYGPTCEERGL